MPAIFFVLKQIAPYALLAMFCGAIWIHGYHTADQVRIEREAKILAESELVIDQAVKRAGEVQRQLVASARVISDTYDIKKIEINELADANRAAMATRMRYDAAGCNRGTLPKPDTSAASGDEGASDFWLVQPAVAERLVNRHQRADEITEIARACQAYVQQITEVINGNR